MEQPIEYIPQQPKQQQQEPKSNYVLVNDLTGKPPPLRGPQTLKAYTQDKEGKTVTLEFNVPYPPKPNCKKCLGRGYTGIISVKEKRGICICKKCYPMV